MLHCGLHAVNARLVGMVRCQWRAIKNTVWQHTGQSEPFGQVSDYISLLLMNMERFFCLFHQPALPNQILLCGPDNLEKRGSGRQFIKREIRSHLVLSLQSICNNTLILCEPKVCHFSVIFPNIRKHRRGCEMWQNIVSHNCNLADKLSQLSQLS